MNFWTPFLPIYMLELGAGSEARALFWSAIAMSSNGVFRMVGGPIWGVLSDRYGRKPMYVRALFGATVTTCIALFAREPWHVSAAMACQGFASGFIPAAVALTSVSVPQSKLTSGLGTVQGAQYAGNMVGPAVGALLAGALGMRGGILIAALLPALGGLLVLLRVPRDITAPRALPALNAVPVGRWRSLGELLGVQFVLGLGLYFAIFVMAQLVRTAAPVALGQIEGTEAATGASGIAFTAAGVASVVGALGLARYAGRTGWVRLSLTLLLALGAAAYVLLGLADSTLLFIAWFSLISFTQGAMMPAANTIIAASVPRERRGTAFGIASSVQAMSFIIGPMGATLFAALSFRWGFISLGAALAATALTAFLFLREPDLNDRATEPAPIPPEPERRETRATA